MPTAVYGVVLLMSAVAWFVMQSVLIRKQGGDPALARAIGRDVKGKISPLLYGVGIVTAFVDTRISDAMYVLVALMWLIPDRRVERAAGKS